MFEMYFHFFESEIIHFNVFAKRTTTVSFNELCKIRKFECCTSMNFSILKLQCHEQLALYLIRYLLL